MDKADRAERDLDHYIYAISHDLKAQMRALRMLPDFIFEDLKAAGVNLPLEVGEHLKMLQTTARDVTAMLEALTTLSRIGRRGDPVVAHSLGNLIGDTADRMPSALDSVEFSHAKGVILGSRTDYSLLFAALLDNARRHGDGRVVVEAAQSGDRINVTWTNGGAAIPEQQRQAVFDPFRTLRAKSETGTVGMGLTLARKVVRSVDGEMALLSKQDGTGCVLNFDLPAAPVE